MRKRMKKVLEEEILYRDPVNNEFLKTQIFEDGIGRIFVVLRDKQKAARLTMRLIELLKFLGEK